MFVFENRNALSRSLISANSSCSPAVLQMSTVDISATRAAHPAVCNHILRNAAVKVES